MLQYFMDSFIHSVTHYPDKPAIIFQEKIITYKELHQRSNEIAQYLINHGVRKEEIIPLILERDADTIFCIVGILKAGCAFLPISPITPCSRVRFILDDIKAQMIISNIELKYLAHSNIKMIKPSQMHSSPQPITAAHLPSHLAYVMYTSGSTGNPKGVLIEHGSMMNLFSSLITQLNLTQQDTILALTDYTFDIALIELLMPLLFAGTIILTEQGTVADGVKIQAHLEENAITLIQATPLTWEILLKQGWKNDGTMKVLVGGEKFKTQLALLLDYQKGNVYNVYGPTETSMWSMMYPIKETLTAESVPLGMPLDNTLIEVFDDTLNPVTYGIPGELYIGGQGLARGYLNNELLTEQQFIYHPITKLRLYKTGDLVLQQDAHTLYYVGRTDDQLKFGGIRVEAGEIESIIEQEPFVTRAVVKVHETEGYYKSLAAYIEVNEAHLFSAAIQTTAPEISHYLKNIYDETYLHAKEYEQGTMNNCGWKSSFTGQLLSIDELNESWQFIRTIMQDANLDDVLEVGCGTGSLLLEYIDKAQEVTVVEISSRAIDYVKSRLTKKQAEKVTFKNDSITTVHEQQKFSCIIVNSVIQYLPSTQALVTVLTQLVQATQSNGTIIIGDVRSLELMDVYLLEKIRTNSTTLEELHNNLSTYYYKSRDTEIVLSPWFFYALKPLLKEITHIDVCVKHGIHKNELNYFRYDVVLHINKMVMYRTPLSIPYVPSLNNQVVQEVLNSNPDKSLIINNIPNIPLHYLLHRLAQEMKHLLPYHFMEDEPSFKTETKRQIESIMSFKPVGYDLFVTYDRTNPSRALELQFHPQSKNQLLRCPDTNDYKEYRTYCCEPFNPWLQHVYFEQLKLKVRQQVISWVNPSVYIWIKKWPLSTNGKLDKKQLQLPIIEQDPLSKRITIEQLQTIWQNITGDNALVDKEFWVHGVSSLCMYFFLATINETFSLNINYHEFHDYNTLDKLAKYIEQLLGSVDISLV